MIATAAPSLETNCLTCGARFDAQHFDVSDFTNPPAPGRRTVVAWFQLPQQFCGVLEGFQQFASENGVEAIETPTIEWQLRVNGRPLDPYLGVRAVLNRWGQAPPRIAIKLDEGNRIEIVANGVAVSDVPIRIGGRLMGRYWFNEPHGPVRAR